MDLKTTLLVLLGLAFAAQAGQLCLGLVPGTEPERVIEAGMLALRLLEGQKVTLVVGTDPLLNLPQADPANLYEVLGPFSPRPTRWRLVPTLKACIAHAAANVLLITAEGQAAGLLPLLTELGKKKIKLSVIALAPEAEPIAEVARATGGTFHLSRDFHSMVLGILEAISHIRGHLCRGPETWILDAANPMPLKFQGLLFLISDGPLQVFLVTPEGHKVSGELLHRGRVFLYRFSLPGQGAHLISSGHAVVKSLVVSPAGAFPWYILLGGTLVVATALWLIWKGISVPRHHTPRVAVLTPTAGRRVVAVPPKGLTLGKGDSSVWIEDSLLPNEPVLELKSVNGRLEAHPLSRKVRPKLNGSPFDTPVPLSSLDRISLGSSEIVVLSTEERKP